MLQKLLLVSRYRTFLDYVNALYIVTKKLGSRKNLALLNALDDLPSCVVSLSTTFCELL